jgi:hypothetical protein
MACGFIASADAADSDSVAVFSDPQGIFYGQDVVAPFKAAVTAVDWKRDGGQQLVMHGHVWERETGDDGRPVHVCGAKAKFPGPLADLDGDGIQDSVTIEDGRFAWHQADHASSPDRTFSKHGFLPFTLGGDLRLPDAQPDTSWNFHGFGDLDNDGRIDLLVSKGTDMQMDGDHAYVPHAHAGFQRGWQNGRWIFYDQQSTLWWFRNTGTAQKPSFAMGQLVRYGDAGLGICADSTHLSAAALDWNHDGRTDVLVHMGNRSVVFLGKEPESDGGVLFDNGHVLTYGGLKETDHRKAIVPLREKSGRIRLYFHGGDVVYVAEQIDPAKPFDFTRLEWARFRNPPSMTLDIFAVPTAVDWNGDGRKDLIVGSESGFIWYLENQDPAGGIKKWAVPVLLEADGRPIRMFKQHNLQGPEEWLIGYANPVAADWDLDGDLDLIVGSHGETIHWFENTGSRENPQLTARGELRYHLDGENHPVSVSWRQRPAVGDLTGDGLPDLLAADGAGLLTLWRRERAGDGSLRLRPPEHPVDAEGHPFQMTGPSRSLGRAKSLAIDWDRDGKMDLITSSEHSLSSRSDFVYRYKNLGEKDGKLLMEFRPREIKVTGLVKPKGYLHYRMIEPVDWHDNGTWQAIAGTCSRHPGLPGTWLYFWDGFKMEEEQLPSPQTWQGWRERPVALMKRPPYGNSAPLPSLEKGARIFTNRPHIFNELPEELHGLHFIDGPIESWRAVCEEPGVLFLLVPYADGPRRNFHIQQAAAQGFRLTGIPDFILFGTEEKNRVAVMAADVKAGAHIIVGHWAVMLSR